MARVAIWSRQRPDVEPVAEGACRLGWKVEWHRPIRVELEPADVVVVVSRKDLPGEIADAYEAEGVPVLVLDLPPLRLERFRSWRALWPGRVNRVPWPDFDRAARLGVAPAADARDSREVLLCGQTPHDSAHGLDVSGMADWYEGAIRSIRAADPEASITWRPHPLWVRRIDGVDAEEHPEEVSFEQALDRPLRAVATYNSTCGLVAMLRGHRVLCDPAAFYSPAAQGRPGERPGTRNLVTIRSVLARAAAVQWSPQEFATGQPLLRALAALDREVAA